MFAQSGSEQPDPLLVVAILTLLAAVAALVPAWVPFLEERPHLVRKLGGPLRSLRRWWRAVLAALVLMLIGYSVFSWPELRLAGLIGALVFLPWLFREALVGWGKSGYLGALWRLVLRPATDRFGVEAAQKADGLSEAFADRLRAGVGQLDLDSLWVLEGALARRKPGSHEAILQYPDGMRLDPQESGAAMAKPRFESALQRLKSIGLISSWEPVRTDTARNFTIRVVLPTADWKTLERLRVAAEVERARKSVVRIVKRIEDAGATLATEPSRGDEAAPALACKAKIRDLSGHGVSVLEYLLRLYLTHAGTVIEEDLSNPEILMSPLKSLTRAHLQAALEELVEEGFLEECRWSRETLHVRVSECLSRRSVAEVVFEWLQDLMVEGRRAWD